MVSGPTGALVGLGGGGRLGLGVGLIVAAGSFSRRGMEVWAGGDVGICVSAREEAAGFVTAVSSAVSVGSITGWVDCWVNCWVNCWQAVRKITRMTAVHITILIRQSYAKYGLSKRRNVRYEKCSKPN